MQLYFVRVHAVAIPILAWTADVTILQQRLLNHFSTLCLSNPARSLLLHLLALMLVCLTWSLRAIGLHHLKQ